MGKQAPKVDVVDAVMFAFGHPSNRAEAMAFLQRLRKEGCKVVELAGKKS